MSGLRWLGVVIGCLCALAAVRAQPTAELIDLNSARALLATGQFDQAEQALLKVIADWRELGPDVPPITDCLDALVDIQMRRNPEGIDREWQQALLARLEKPLGADSLILSHPLQRIADSALEAHDFPAADAAFARAQALRDRAYGIDDFRAIIPLAQWGNALRAKRRFAEARVRLQDADARAERVKDTVPSCQLHVLFPLAHLAFNEGDYGRTIALLERLLPVAERYDNAEERYLPRLHSVLGSAWLALRRYDRAEAAYRRAQALYRAAGPEWGIYVASCWRALGVTAQAQGEFARAEKCYWQALAIERSPETPALLAEAETLLRLGGLYLAWGRYTRARHCATLVEDLFGLTCTLDQPLDYRQVSGMAALRLGRYAQAAPLLQDYLTDAEPAFGADHPLFGLALLDAATLALAQGRDAEAAATLDRARALFDRRPEQPEARGQCRLLLARAALAQQRWPEAQAHLDAARAILAPLGQTRAAALARASTDAAQGTRYARQGFGQLAVVLLRRAVRAQQALLGEVNPIPAASLAELGRAYRQVGRPREAGQALARAEAIQRQTLGDSHPELALTLRARAELDEVAHPEDADAGYRRALEMLLDTAGPAHPETARTLEHYAAFLRAR